MTITMTFFLLSVFLSCSSLLKKLRSLVIAAKVKNVSKLMSLRFVTTKSKK
ncbi:unnamed protein product [Amoebophrya sp. A25]|nr:unnamed protein product [Amoebophrya sp. A25]|eukprot:GSA25T00014134001.1